MELPKGFRFAGVACGIKSRQGALDLTLIVADNECTAAGVYTTNQVVAAPVVLSRSRTPSQQFRGIVVNSGNANACTGAKGMTDALEMSKLAASAVADKKLAGTTAAHEDQWIVMSTGIIGRFLPMDKIANGIRQAAAELATGEHAYLNAADGIMTTDIARKIASRQVKLPSGKSISIVGMAKGAGMIGPKMATMLGCLITDATFGADQAQRLLQQSADRSFNCISVEGHTSTNDSLVLLATKPTSDQPGLDESDEAVFSVALTELCIELAKKIPDDGEGATHLIEITIRGASSDADADRIARSVALSNLVKTAITGGDPNWGRIVSAVGYAGVPIKPEVLSLHLNGFHLFDRGEPLEFEAKAVSQSIRGQKLTEIELLVGYGRGTAKHWTTDLNAEYVRFNSEYST
ncbi:MAG: bifunctional glutamate N-acetyltransferase/amino-acid acetyltransferase ArgJ [Pirellulaceae bacterium]|nr:bifunctional glutamate N-acetyltransferase/amino-acid acetyltransferase ArgJ [Pirellulaceae bacterium]